MKKILRKELLNKRLMLNDEEIKSRSHLIVEKIKSSEDFKKSKIIGVYSAIKKEVELDELFKEDKIFCFPKVIKDIIEFYYVERKDDLILGTFNVLEPKEGLKKVNKNDMDIIYIPVVGISKNMYRIGYGKGYYDKYLSDYENLKVAICYDFQIVEEEFNEPHDIKLDKIIGD